MRAGPGPGSSDATFTVSTPVPSTVLVPAVISAGLTPSVLVTTARTSCSAMPKRASRKPAVSYLGRSCLGRSCAEALRQEKPKAANDNRAAQVAARTILMITSASRLAQRLSRPRSLGPLNVDDVQYDTDFF